MNKQSVTGEAAGQLRGGGLSHTEKLLSEVDVSTVNTLITGSQHK